MGSVWFTAGEGQDMAEMADKGLVDLSVFENVAYPLGRSQRCDQRAGEPLGGIQQLHHQARQ